MKKGKPEDFPHLNVPRPGVEPGRLAALVFETNASIPHLNVPRPGVEPGRLAALVFETNASTNSAIWA